MNIYEKKQRWKLFLFISAILIGVGSLTYTNRLVNDLSEQERKKVELWAEATRQIIYADPVHTDLSFPHSVIQNNTTVPVILVDSSGVIAAYRNLDTTKVDNPDYLDRQLQKMRIENDSIVVDLGDNYRQFLFYRNSFLLRRLQYFPYVQLAVILLFILVSYFAFSASRNAEQNKVWVGLSKETAHQLGTPTSSMNGWVELLKERGSQKEIIYELDKDVKRLEKITERFSKIGSKPVLKYTNIIEVINNSLLYLKSRSSDKIDFIFHKPDDEIKIPLNEALFEWVIENVCKNAMDAMEGKGTVKIDLYDNTQIVYLDVSDEGKGISKSRFKTIFKPGYTTKKRGWGLGLSLSKRIVEAYHGGKIFVLHSEPGKGTTLRIVMNK